MLKRIIIAAAFLAACDSAVAIADSVENPAYIAWAKVKPGSSIVTESTRGPNKSAEVTAELKDVSDDHCTVVQSMQISGHPIVMPEQIIHHELTDPEQIKKFKDFDKDTDQESVTVPAGTFKCKKLEESLKDGSQMTLWATHDGIEIDRSEVMRDVIRSCGYTLPRRFPAASPHPPARRLRPANSAETVSTAC